MAYIGQSIKNGTFAVLDTSGNTYNGSNTTFSLGTQVGSPAQLLVSHDGVVQKPGTDYTLATGGTQITFTTAPASGASIFIVEISGAVGGTITPSDDSVTADKINDNIISGHTALTTPPATTDEFLISDAGTIKRIDYSVLGNTPAFMVVTGTDLTISTGTWTKATNWATPIYDTDSAFSSSKFTVPTGKGGKYIFHAHVYFTSGDDQCKVEARLYKNGSNAGGSSTGSATVRTYLNGSNRDVDKGWTWIANLSAGDYIEFYINQNNGDNQTLYRESWLSGHRLIGV